MTISTTANRITYTGNGVTSAFSFPYAFFAKADLVVVETVIATGAQTVKALTTHYTISGTKDSLDHYPNGGTVTAVLVPSSIPPSTVTWTIYRDPSAVQSTDLVENDSLPAESVEATFDYQTMLIQRANDRIARCLQQPEGDTAAISRLPGIVTRANKYLTFDSSGNPAATDAATASGTSVTATGTPTARLLADWVSDTGNPKAWGAVGDGGTSDQSAITAIVADAYSVGYAIWWPDGTYVTTATIPNFHDVRHVGPGVVKRGSNTFSIDPSLHPGATNILYVATTGVDTNDGLSSSQPRLTAQATGNLIYKYSYGDVTWKVQFAAGTWVEAADFTKRFPTPRRVLFLGAPVSNGTEPTTIFDNPGGNNIGINFQFYCFVQVEDIKFTDYFDSGAPSSSGLSFGILAGDHCDLYTKNVWSTNCDNGIGVWHIGTGRIEAGVHRDNGNGVIALSNVVMTVGYGGTVADITGTTGTAFIDCEIGVNMRESSSGHVDYCYFSGITNMALYLSQNSRCNNVESTYNTCNIAVRCEALCYWYENPGNENTFTNNTTDLMIRSMSTTGGTNAAASLYGPALLDNDTSSYNTSSLTDVLIYTRTFIAKELGTRGRGFKLTIWGDVTGTAGSKTITIKLGATTILTAVIAAATTNYKVLVDFVQRTSTGSPTQRVFTEIHEQPTIRTIDFLSKAIDMAADIDLTVNHKVANGADQNNIGNIRLEIVH